MKILISLISITLLVGFTNSNFDQNIWTIWKAGLFESSGCVSNGQHGDHQTERKTCDELNLVKEVSVLHIKVGMNFGIKYQIEPSIENTCFEETRVLLHPPIKQPDGKVTTTYSRTYKVGNCPGAIPYGVDVFSWAIDHEWEAVEGEWQFKVLVDGKTAISKTFKTYK